MKITLPAKKSAKGLKSKSRPSAKTANKTRSRGAEHQERLDQILQNSELRYRRLFENAQDGILILDAQTGAIEDVSPRPVVMDISLPGMSGIEATRVIKARSPGTYVVMLSIQDQQVYRNEEESAGASAFVSKLHTHAELIPVLTGLLEGVIT